MKVEVKIDKNYKEPLVVIWTDDLNEEIKGIIKNFESKEIFTLMGYEEDQIAIIALEDILRIYSEEKKVYAQSKDNIYRIKQRLYEIEEQLDAWGFVRISNSEIVNLAKVKKLDLSFSGTIGIFLEEGLKSYVSRRYVRNIKTQLGI